MSECEASSSGTVSALLDDLRAHREQLVALSRELEPNWADALVRAIDDVDERMLIADEPQHVQRIAEAVLEFSAEETPEGLLAAIARRARAVVPGCSEAGIILLRARGRLELSAVAGPVAAACGRLQIDLGEGPAVTVIHDPRPVRVMDISADDRWPAFARSAAAHGTRAMLALPLRTGRGVIGSLALYAADAGGFPPESEPLGAAFAVHAGAAAAHIEIENNLRIGMQTREEIGRAVGILMERHRVTAKDAFDMLVMVSQHSHRKLRDVAAWMNETGEDPTRLIHTAPTV